MTFRPFDHLALKLASLALAMLLWFVIAGEKTSEMGVSIPIELQNFPKDLELTGEPVNRRQAASSASASTPSISPSMAAAPMWAARTSTGARSRTSMKPD